MSRLAPWVSRILIILIGYVGATIALRLVPVANTHSVESPEAIVVTASAGPSIADMALSAAGKHIFGEAGVKPAPKVERKVIAPETKLNLSLIGVYAANPADQALAIISANGKPEQVFRVGESVIGRAVLHEVRTSEVVIDNGGREEILKLPEKVASTGRNVGLENLPGATNTASAGNAQNTAGPIQLPDSPKAIRDTLVKNPAMLNKLVSAVPYRENGRILGYRLTPKQNAAILEANGVLPGDVVTQVNGIALANQKNGIRALRKLVKASSIDLTILRDGVEIPIVIPLQ